MPTYNLRGIDVDFPYEAYDCQLVYMEKVIQSLQNKSNALLESPTGTGKTLCLLCATLAWRKSLGNFSKGRRQRSHIRGSQDPDEELSQGRWERSKFRESQGSDEVLSQSQSSEFPTIVYTSRTHSQIRQVIQELKRSNYRCTIPVPMKGRQSYEVLVLPLGYSRRTMNVLEETYRPKMMVLGSREQLCIHEKVRLLRGKIQTNACQALCKKRTKRYCSHFSRVTEFANKNPSLGEDPVDIEDLVNIGKSCGPCPYYLSREFHKDVDILFAPYNYLIDRGNRKSLKIDWNNSILIFDEAHNLESLCADAASFDLPSSLLTACISEAQDCVDLATIRRDMSSDKSCNPNDFSILRALLLKLEKRIAEVPIESKELGFTKPGPYIYELLAELMITQKTATMLMDTIDKACMLLEEDATGNESGGPHRTDGIVCRLESMGDILRLIFKDNSNAHAQYYRVHVQEVEASATEGFRAKTSRTLSWWCFNPGIAMEEFSRLGVGSIILTSGTLSPLDSFAEELKLEFPIRLENPHVISGNQIWAGVAPVGPSGYAFNSSYRSRGSIEYKLELGNAIVNFARIVPDGLLIFFPSYYLLDQCISCWKTMGQLNLSTSTTIWERICKHKSPVVEPRQSSLFPSAIEDYMTKLKDSSTSGAIFFAVCRGKVSEGLDFADHAGRAVVVTGLPFATMIEPRVRLKREYLDQQVQSQKIGSKGLTGEEWYSQQASRAVNQAVGRVIRHRHDYGAIIFCDERFAHSNRQSQISLWIQPHIKCYSKFGDVVYTLTRFFRDGAARGPPKLELTRKEENENVKFPESSLLLDTHPENLHVRETKATSVDISFPLGSESTVRQVKQRNISNLLSEIVPANRSSLSSDKLFGNPSLNVKNILVSGKTSVPDTDGENGDLIAPCVSKKRKLLITGPDCSKKYENFDYQLNNLVKHENLKVSENVNAHDPQESGQGLVNDKLMRQKNTTAHIHQNSKGISQTAAHHDNEEKGSAFLIQVQEKLTDSEYQEFIGFMKALKSKAMKIGPVLQSIVGLFSLPGRASLLHGFKEYLPAKFHSLYERYLCSGSNAAGI